MLHKSSLLALVVAFAVGSVAQAAVMGTATQKANPPGTAFGSPDQALGSPWVSWDLGLASTAGELIGGIDVTITGQLHQRWTFDEDLGDFVATGNSANSTNGDTHLRAVSGALFGAGPTENNPGTGSPLPSTASAKYGVGTSLAGAWGITNAATTATLAYIVFPSDQLPSLNINVAVANPAGDIIANLTKADFPITGGGGGTGPTVADYLNSDATLNKVVATTITATGDAPITWGNLTNFSYTPGFGALPAAPGLSKQPTWNPATQAFSWDTSGSTRGTYVWNVQATNGVSNDTGSITVEVRTVPEPATLVMIGLAAFGCVGIARRRG